MLADDVTIVAQAPPIPPPAQNPLPRTGGGGGLIPIGALLLLLGLGTIAVTRRRAPSAT